MAEFLSQDEIDALLDIAEQGEDIDGEQEEKVVSKEKNYSLRCMIKCFETSSPIYQRCCVKLWILSYILLNK
jgi:flagellar motor switch protein FliM